MHRLHITDICLKELKVKPPRPEHRRESHIELRIRQIQPGALSAASRELVEVFLQMRLLQEAFRHECSRRGEERWIVVDVQGGHAHRGLFRDVVVAVLQLDVREDTLRAVGDSVADAQAFVDDGGEVGELFHLLPFGRGVGVRCEGLEFGLQLLEDGRVGNDVEACDGEDVCCGGGAGADDGLGFVLHVVVGFLLGPDLWVGEHVVEYSGLALGFLATCDGGFDFENLLEHAVSQLDELHHSRLKGFHEPEGHAFC